MKERPILFSSPMVRAILDGRKTQTRRIVSEKHLPFIEDLTGRYLAGEWENRPFPYGKPEDRLWVRETWRTSLELDASKPSSFCRWPVRYEADGAIGRCGALRGDVNGKIRSSIFMPRWASRLTLENTAVRVERLQDISEEDAKAEGVEPINNPHGGSTLTPYWHGFKSLWQQINGADSWNANPWVWVIEFRRIEL